MKTKTKRRDKHKARTPVPGIWFEFWDRYGPLSKRAFVAVKVREDGDDLWYEGMGCAFEATAVAVADEIRYYASKDDRAYVYKMKSEPTSFWAGPATLVAKPLVKRSTESATRAVDRLIAAFNLPEPE